MRVRNFIIYIFLILIFSIKIFSSPWSISMSSGIIRTTQPDVSDLNQYTYFPEIQIEREVLQITKCINWISMAIYFGVWDDFVKKQTSMIMDHVTYNYKFSIVGTRLFLNSRFRNISWSLIGGISKNYIKSKYIGGSSYSGDIGVDHDCNMNLYHFGINIDYLIFTRISLGVGGVYEFTPRNDLEVNPRLGFKVNLRYDI